MVPPDAVVAISEGTNRRRCRLADPWLRPSRHGFTNPKVGALNIPGVDYNAAAARRSWAALHDYLDELFG